MVFKGLIAAAAAAALVAAPTVASAQASAATAAAATTEVAPAEENVEGSELRGGFIIPLAAIILIILGILTQLKDDEDRVSP